MDKYTYSLKAEKIQKLVRQEDYLEAAKIADTVDWKQEHNVRLLSAVSEAYENTQEYDKAIDVLLTAYERTSLGKRHIYKLTELALKAGNIEDAEAFYKRYLEEAPDENNRYILRYKIAEAKGESLDKRITILETYKKYEFEEEWACRLAELYNEAGMEKECVALCDEIILWFGVGSYVDRAMELKEMWQPLTESQREHRENKEYYAARVKAVANEMSAVADQDEEEIGEADASDIPEESPLPDDELPVIAISPEVAGSDIHKALGEEPAAVKPEPVAPAQEEEIRIPEDDEVEDVPEMTAEPEPDPFDLALNPAAFSAALEEPPAAQEIPETIPEPAPEKPAAPEEITDPEPAVEALPEEPAEVQEEITEPAAAPVPEAEKPAAKDLSVKELEEPRYVLADDAVILLPDTEEDVEELSEEIGEALEEEAGEELREEPVSRESVRESGRELERTRNLKDILRSTIGGPRRVRENLDPTKEFNIPQELLDEADGVKMAEPEPVFDVELPELPEEPESDEPVPAVPEQPAVREKPAAPEKPAVKPAQKKPAPAEKPVPAVKPAQKKEEEKVSRETEPAQEVPALDKTQPVVPRMPAPRMQTPDDEPLDSPFDMDGPAMKEKIPLAADEGVLPVISFEETERAVWEDHSRRIKENEPLNMKGMERCVFLTVPAGEDSVEAAVSALETYYDGRGQELPQIARIAADKLNRRGLVKSLPQLAGKSLIIDRASALDDDMIKEVLRVIGHLDTSKVFVLTDDAAGTESIRQRFRTQIVANAEALGRSVGEEEEAPQPERGAAAEPERRPVRKVRKVQPVNFERISPDHELSERDFIRYADFFAQKLECVLDDSAFDALEDEVDAILHEGGRLTAGEAEAVIEDAAERASRKMFGKKYDKEGFLVLRERDFD